LTTSWRAWRRRLLTPGVAETSIEKRGFHRKSAAGQERLETVGKTFLLGYGEAMEARTPTDAVAALEPVPDWLRGFAYEGAGMGFAVLDGLPFGRSDNVDRFLADPRADDYRYLVYVGIGWAMARIPRFRWPKPESLDPALVPLVLDGYGFHQAYFHTAKYATGRYRDPRFPWPGGKYGWYADNAIDQGIGRAAWFICGTDTTRVADLIDSFPPERRRDLYAGAGLAAAYAGGVEEEELRTLLRRAGEHRDSLAQGAAFAADARVRAGAVPEHSALATEVLCGATPEDAARLTRDARPAEEAEGDLPAYEVWRQRTAAQLVSLGGINT
jgi:enediyne biosynthesis protein E3